MRIAVGISGSAGAEVPAWQDSVAFVREADRLGVDFAWSAEAWIYDAVSPLGYLAARTERILLGAGIMQITARTPAMTAMTAASLAAISGGRFVLGLGASGPQVVEGLHGIPFQGSVRRLQEHLEIVRAALRGEKLDYAGQHYRLPLPGSPAKPMRLGLRAERVPIYLGALTPRALALTGALADGWLAQVFVPEAASTFLAPLHEAARAAGRDPAELDLQAGGAVEFGDRERLVAERKAGLAFTLGAMGTARKNFYTDAYARAGYEREVRAVQRAWLDGRREEAQRGVPDELVQRTSLLGDDEAVRDRIRAYRDAGITTLRLNPAGASVAQRVATLERALELVRQVEREAV